ncbi:MAG: glycosyltransferase, partial [Candidatus Saccharimonas sp.]
MKKVCVIIPAYNESSVIKDVIKKAKKVFSKAKKDYSIDIVLVNDGSKDNTLEQARKG